MTRRGPFLHHRFRLRLTIAIVLVSAVASGTLGVTAYLVVDRVRDARLAEIVEQEVALSLAALTQPPSLEALRDEVEEFANDAPRSALADTPAGTIAAGEVSLDELPEGLRAAARQDGFVRRSVVIGNRPYLVVGAEVPELDSTVFYLFDRSFLQAEMSTLRTVLVAAWLLLVALTALVANAIARRVLWPVAEGARAARRVAEGLLDTRLPTDGNDEFAEWATAFNSMTGALQEKIDALTAAAEREQRFTADVAHELRTPLSAAINAAGLLELHRDELPGDAGRAADLVVADVRRLRRLVEDLLEISRLGSGREVVHHDRVLVRTLTERLVRARGWHEDVTVTGDDVDVVSDRRRLERIVGNLIDNALRHGGGSATVTTGTVQGEVLIAVDDRGPGVPVDDVTHLFEPFHKLDRPRSGGGTGLGLTIAAQHARLLGGRIDVESSPGHGASFRLCLPPRPWQAEQPAS